MSKLSGMFESPKVAAEVRYLNGLRSRALAPLDHSDIAAAARLAFGCGVARSYQLAEMVLGPLNDGRAQY